MSVDRTDYLIFGVNIDPKSFDWEEFLPEIEGRESRFLVDTRTFCG